MWFVLAVVGVYMCAFLSFVVVVVAAAQVSQYRMWCDTVVPTLQRYHAEGYALLVVSNQNAIKSVRQAHARGVVAAWLQGHCHFASRALPFFFSLSAHGCT